MKYEANDDYVINSFGFFFFMLVFFCFRPGKPFDLQIADHVGMLDLCNSISSICVGDNDDDNMKWK